MIGSKTFSRVLLAAGLIGFLNVPGRGKQLGWTTGTHRFGYNGSQHSDARVAAAEVKRERRRAKVASDIRAGGYGLTPFVGQKGHTPDTSCGVKALQARGLIALDFAPGAEVFVDGKRLGTTV